MSRVREIWDQGAAIYDEIYASNIPYHQSHSVIVDLLPKDRPLEILDLGAGTGLLASIILQRVPGSRVTCLEFSPNMLTQARQRVRDFGARASLVCDDIRTWDPPARYDAVVACNSLVYKELNLAECYRKYAEYLRAAGLLINSTVVRRDDLPHLIAAMQQLSGPDAEPPSEAVTRFAQTTGKDIAHFGDGSLATAESIERHLKLLTQAGLAACCPWHYMTQAVLLGRKAEQHAE